MQENVSTIKMNNTELDFSKYLNAVVDADGRFNRIQ